MTRLALFVCSITSVACVDHISPPLLVYMSPLVASNGRVTFSYFCGRHFPRDANFAADPDSPIFLAGGWHEEDFSQNGAYETRPYGR